MITLKISAATKKMVRMLNNVNDKKMTNDMVKKLLFTNDLYPHINGLYGFSYKSFNVIRDDALILSDGNYKIRKRLYNGTLNDINDLMDKWGEP